RMVEENRRRFAQRLARAAKPGSVGRGRRRAGSVPADAVQILGAVFRLQGAPDRGKGGRDRRQSSSVDVRSRRPAEQRQLGRGGGATGVLALSHRRGTSSRRCRGGAPRRERLESLAAT